MRWRIQRQCLPRLTSPARAALHAPQRGPTFSGADVPTKITGCAPGLLRRSREGSCVQPRPDARPSTPLTASRRHRDPPSPTTRARRSTTSTPLLFWHLRRQPARRRVDGRSWRLGTARSQLPKRPRRGASAGARRVDAGSKTLGVVRALSTGRADRGTRRRGLVSGVLEGRVWCAAGPMTIGRLAGLVAACARRHPLYGEPSPLWRT